MKSRFISFFGVLVLVLLFSNLTNAQTNNRGKIIKRATAEIVPGANPKKYILDPDGNGFVSEFPTGFSLDGYYVDEFELKMFGIPKLGGDTIGDNIGKSCGITDLIPDSKGFSVYARRDQYNNLIFRFRVGDDNPSVEAWTILLDTDGLFGANDPNATPENPGFEIDITLIKNSNKGINVYNINGIESCPTPLLNYSFDTNFQIAVGDEQSCGDADYFYDFFVPFSEIAAAFGIDENTGLRYAAVTNVSATCAMAGQIADISGVNYNDYKDCVSCAFEDLINNQCPTAIVDLCGTCSGFEKDKVSRPKIYEPLKAGQDQIFGATVEPNIFIRVEVYTNIGTPENPSWSSNPADARETKTTYSVDTLWNVMLDGVLQGYDRVVARAQKTETSVPCAGIGGNDASSTSITVVTFNIKPVIAGTANPLTYTENDGAVAIEPTNTVTDADDEFLVGATVEITSNYVNGEDILGFQSQFGITGSFDAATGILTLSGTATLAEYQSVLRNVTYTNTSENPSSLTRTVQFVVSDPLDDSNPYTRDIIVVPVNDAPIANAGSDATDEDTPKDLTLTGSDVDNTASQLTYIIVSQPSNGVLSGAINNELPGTAPLITYTPNANFNGDDSFTFKIFDGGLNSATVTFTIKVNPINDAPVASGPVNNVIVLEDTDFANNPIELQASDVDNDPLQYIIVSGPSHGTLSGTGKNQSYKPTANYNGSDSFVFKVFDGIAYSNEFTVNITVQPVNDPPLLSTTSINNTRVYANGGVVIDANLSVTDIDNTTLAGVTVSISNNFESGDDLIFSNQNGITGTYDNVTGVLTLSGTASLANYSTAIASITFVNDAASGATKRITFVANDGESANNLSLPFNVFIDYPENFNPPTGNTPQAFETFEDTPQTFCLDVSDADGDEIIITQIDNQQNGSFTISDNLSNGNQVCFVYTPPADYSGPASADITVCDVVPANQACTPIHVVINVIAQNDPPIAVNDAINTDEDTDSSPVDIVINDTDIDSSIDPASVDLDTASIGTIEKSITFQGKGTLTVTNAGLVTFVPAPNYYGTLNAYYTVRDVEGAVSNTGKIVITINSVNDPPVAVNDVINATEDQVTLPKDILSNDTDIDNSIDNSTVDLDPTTPAVLDKTFVVAGKGTFTDNGSGSVTFTPFPDYFNDPNDPTTWVKAFYTVKDISGALSNVAEISVKVLPVNDPPVANNDALDDLIETDEDVISTPKNVLANDFDDSGLDPTSLDLNPATPVADKSFAVSGKGVFKVQSTTATEAFVIFEPAKDYFNDPNNSSTWVTAFYTVRDVNGLLSNQAKINVIVLPVNDPPTISYSDNPNNPFYEDSTRLVCPDVADIDFFPLRLQTATLISGKGNLIIPTDANCFGYEFQPDPNYNGESVWQIGVCDDEDACTSIQITINQLPVNDPPDARHDTVSTFSGTTTVIDALVNDLPIESPYQEFYSIYLDRDSVDVLTIIKVEGLQGFSGTAEIIDNEISYTPNFGLAHFSDSVRYWVQDSGGLIDSAVVFIDVGPLKFRVFEAVSPNGDNLNDYWRINGIDQDETNVVRIFDRFNNLVFETTNYSNESNYWNGQSNHGLVKGSLPEGTYYYTISIDLTEDNVGRRLFSGYVILKRN